MPLLVVDRAKPYFPGMESTGKNRSLAAVSSVEQRDNAHEFSAANVSPRHVGGEMDPFLSIDHFKMRGPVFAPHPHAGFSAVTYLFEDSDGEFVNRDSLGHTLVAKPGAVIWTVAGRGVLHDERPRERGRVSHGLQIFVNLPSDEKRQEPRLLFADGPEVPVLDQGGVRVRVVSGAFRNVASQLDAPARPTVLDVALQPRVGFQYVVPREHNAFIYIIGGELLVGDERRAVRQETAMGFRRDGDAIFVESGSTGAHFVLFAGRPLQEPVVAHGPFIMSNEQQIAQAVEDYRAGRMGQLAPLEGAL